MEPALTTSNGAPIGDVSHSLVAGSVGGPTLLQDFVLIDRLAHFDREVIPERRVHARVRRLLSIISIHIFYIFPPQIA